MLSSLRRTVLSPSSSEHTLLQRRMKKETQVGGCDSLLCTHIVYALKPDSLNSFFFLPIALGEDEEIIDAIEKELNLADDDMNIISETATDSGRRQVRWLHLERQRSSQFDAEPLSPQRPQPTTPLSPHEGKVGLVEQVSSQKSINVPPEKMDKGATKNEHSHLIQAEAAETGNVS